MNKSSMQDVLEKAIWGFIEENKELILQRIIGSDGLILTAGADKDIKIETSGAGKAFYNGAEIKTGGGGITDHALLSNLSYASSGHTGFAANGHNHSEYLKLSGGQNLMLQSLSMNSNEIYGMNYTQDWNTMTSDEGVAKGNIAGASGFMSKTQTPGASWYFQNGLKLPQGTDASKSATPSEGQIYWATDTDKLYIGRGSTWKEIGPDGITDHGGLTGLGDDDHTQYLLANGSRSMTGSLGLNGYYLYLYGTTHGLLKIGDFSMLFGPSVDIQGGPGGYVRLNPNGGYHAQVRLPGIEPWENSNTTCGSSGYKWSDVWTVNQHTGDLLFSEQGCPVCDQLFQVGDILALQVVEVGEETCTVPVHAKHSDGDIQQGKYKWTKIKEYIRRSKSSS